MTDGNKILIVDDQPGVTKVASSLLRLRGFEVENFNNPQDAIPIVQTVPFKFVLVDFMMPEMSGLDFIKAVKESPVNSHTKCVILTAKTLSEKERQDIYQLGAEVLLKPFKSHDLLKYLS